MNGDPHFIVDVQVEFFGDLQRYGKRVRNLVLQSSGIGPATHLNLQVRALDKHARFFSLKDFVLQGSTLNCQPVRLLSDHS